MIPLSNVQKGNALMAIDQFSRALAFDDPLCYKIAAKQVPATERAMLIAALDAAAEAKVEDAIRSGRSDVDDAHLTHADVVDVILDHVGTGS